MTSRFFDRVYHFGDDDSEDQFLEIVRAHEDLLGVEVLTYSNALVKTQLDLWTRSGLTEVIEEWRQQ